VLPRPWRPDVPSRYALNLLPLAYSYVRADFMCNSAAMDLQMRLEMLGDIDASVIISPVFTHRISWEGSLVFSAGNPSVKRREEWTGNADCRNPRNLWSPPTGGSERSNPMKVADCMTPDPACLSPDDTSSAAIALMESGDFRAVPIIQNGELVGIISDRDIRRYRQEPERTKVSAIMSRNPICISPNDSINEAVRTILSYKIGGLPVIKEHKLVGIITTTDILKAVLGFPALD
jgi:predicted transcriptional regulator